MMRDAVSAGVTQRISVLIPCYNLEKHIAQTIESVLAQTWRCIEIIVVDDGSTDDSRNVIERYADRGVISVAQDNGGAAAARNHAFRRSSGEFVLFLDGDDLICPDHLSALHAAASTTPGSLAMSQWERFLTSPDEAPFPSRTSYVDCNGSDWLIEDWITGRPMTQAGMFLIPRELLDRLGLWSERLSLIDDFEFFARIISGSRGVRFAAGARLYYRSGRAGSLSGKTGRKAAESELTSLIMGTGHLLRLDSGPRARRASANLLQGFDFRHFPRWSDLRRQARAAAESLGGGTLAPDGPPGFHRLRRLVGWRPARIVQRTAEVLRGQ